MSESLPLPLPLPLPLDWHLDHQGRTLDLNDDATYSWVNGFPEKYLDFSGHDLAREVHDQLAFSLYYMTILRPSWDEKQYQRVRAFAIHFAKEVREPDRRENKRWLRKQLFRILDETENQC